MTLNKLLRLNNGYVMPAIGLGTYLMGGEKLQAAVEQAILLGSCVTVVTGAYQLRKFVIGYNNHISCFFDELPYFLGLVQLIG